MNKPFKIGDNIKATAGQRFGNYIIDVIILYFIIFLLAAILIGITMTLGNYAFSEWWGNMSDLEGSLIFIMVMLSYYILMETISSRSLAKYITGTIVILEDGSKPDLGTIVKRSFCRLIPFDALSFFASDARGWHDSISDTYVVKTAAFKAEKKLFDELDEIGVDQSYQSQIQLK